MQLWAERLTCVQPLRSRINSYRCGVALKQASDRVGIANVRREQRSSVFRQTSIACMAWT